MSDLTKLDQILGAGAMIIQEATAQIRETQFAPVDDHVRAIGKVLGEIFKIQHAIYEVQPELQPQWMECSVAEREANLRLGDTLRRAHELVLIQHHLEAIVLLTQYAWHESSLHHRQTALAERNRLEKDRAEMISSQSQDLGGEE